MTGFAVYEDLDRTKRRRSRRTPFDKNQHYYKDEGNTFTFPKATEAQLKAVREKLQKQQRSDRIKTIISFIVAIPISIFRAESYFLRQYNHLFA
ncbi:hypothetical protein IMCC3317_43060 [Kordia antarctica]|uniref:Uncharacterized protein n=1 Tax=Kordia antarctica TaxID=1218801 RepID=A0A7L4ZRU1_9FLAO|nr:hypothetical protein [Kordia antarctica]QHI38906.1 hypothetical protein IMCC3317_43060 [Kordia antarctica]